jgi:hypothetical protein
MSMTCVERVRETLAFLQLFSKSNCGHYEIWTDKSTRLRIWGVMSSNLFGRASQTTDIT